MAGAHPGEPQEQVIVVDDSDDDVVVLDEERSQPSNAHASSTLHHPRPTRPSKRQRSSRSGGVASVDAHAPAVEEGSGSRSRQGGREGGREDDDVVFVKKSRGADGGKKVEQEPAERKGDLPAMIECTICLSAVQKPSLTKCGHIFCHDCIRSWLQSNKKCPHCRSRTTLKDLRQIYAMTSDDPASA